MNRRNFITKTTKLSIFTFMAINGISNDLFACDCKDSIDSMLKAKKLLMHNRIPINAEAFPHLLKNHITSYENIFIRNNGMVPDRDDNEWNLEISGESIKKVCNFSIDNLKKLFEELSVVSVMECGGNGRAEFFPAAKGNQWNLGAVACLKWTGVRLGDVLKHCGIKDDAVYIGFYAKDKHLSNDNSKSAISRGCPIEKALDPNTLLAYKMNDEEIPFLHGYPLRLVVPGYPGSASGKWVHKIVVRNKVHDGTKMTGSAYRVPKIPVAPGMHVDKKDMKIIEEMPIKSIITSVKSGHNIKKNTKLEISGHAWSGDSLISKVMISKDYGETWKEAKVNKNNQRFAWQDFSYNMLFDKEGYYEVWARAVDIKGHSQPMVMPGWNPKGYLNNAAHHIAIMVEK